MDPLPRDKGLTKDDRAHGSLLVLQELLRCSNAEGERLLAQLEQLNLLHSQSVQVRNTQSIHLSPSLPFWILLFQSGSISPDWWIRHYTIADGLNVIDSSFVSEMGRTRCCRHRRAFQQTAPWRCWTRRRCTTTCAYCPGTGPNPGSPTRCLPLHHVLAEGSCSLAK